MKLNVDVRGIKVTANEFEQLTNLDDDFDKLAEHSMKRIQLAAWRRGPVLTGFLTSNLAADENRHRTAGIPKGSWDLHDGTDYTMIQEFEHRSKSAFIRRSVIEEEPKFAKAVKRLLKEEMWTL